MGRVLLFARTIRHLRAHQALALLAARSGIRSRSPGAALPANPLQSRDALTSEMLGWGYPFATERQARLATDACADSFTFAGTSRSFDEIDWQGRGASPLWTYQFHYLEPLEALAWSWRQARPASALASIAKILELWDQRARGGVGWDPYPASIRTGHLCTALLLCGDALPSDVRDRAFSSLNAQLAHLAGHLEHDLLGNHLLANVCALSRGALLFEPGSIGWTSRARALFRRELANQILRDGLHQERTPMYHAIVLRAALEEALLRRAAGGRITDEETERLRLMLRADGLLRRPDNAIRVLNDSATSEAPSRAYLERLGARVLGHEPSHENGAFWLRDAGYAGLKGLDASCVVDACPPEPAWQPGHAHCDALSFELDALGRQLVVDSGLHGYDGDPFREYVRSTRAHNTLSINGREQGEVWGTFRMARRWTVRAATTVDDRAARFAFRASISPFWSSRVRHTRDFRMRAASFEVRDVIEGAEGLSAESFVHLHPDLTALVQGNAVSVHAAGREVARIEFSGADQLRVIKGEEHPHQGWYCPDFGQHHAAPVIVARTGRLGASHSLGYVITWQ